MPASSKTIRICETCGSPIDETSSGDLGCMVCLLDAGLDADLEQIEEPYAPVPDEAGVYIIEHRSDGSAWELGRGAMGVTYLAVDQLLDRRVALKIINTNLGSHSAEARERFMREARAAAALRHPNVATVYQFGIREGTSQFFYAMELVEGETLEERVRRLGPLDVVTTIDIALQVTAALEAAEQRGLVHRDLKPGNLMLVSHDDVVGALAAASACKTNRRLTQTPLQRTDRQTVRRARRVRPTNVLATVKVIDFGVAKAVTDKTNPMALTHGGFVGTPAFASPEQFTNAPVDVRSDIYSLGVTLWFLLTGHMLFSGRTVEEIQDTRRSKPLPTEQLRAAHVPHRFISLLTSMLAIEPAARPAGASELARKLNAIRVSIGGRWKTAARLAIAAAIIVVTTVVAVREFQLAEPTSSIIPEKSVAVLPFENLSDDPNSAYFAEGIQEEILTRLASIGDLKVISRTSTQSYRSKPRHLPQIAKQLGVANILDGSVQKAADQVRVNVRLINAQTDSHLWAETYDQKLTDVFSVESEIAKRVADSLQAKLTGREKQALAVKPTNNPEAYEAYLRGLAFETRSESASPAVNLLTKAIGFYEQAVELDPDFALAWARLSRADAQVYSSSTTPAIRRDAAKHALEKAQKLEAKSPETLFALGYYQYWVLHDYGSAKTTFAQVNRMLPGSSEVPRALGLIARREGNWDQSTVYLEQALALDPRNVVLLVDAAWTYVMLRQFPTALKLYDRALDLIPNDPELMAAKASVYQAQGNLQEAARFLSQIDEQAGDDTFEIRITQLRLERNYTAAIQLLQARLAKFHFESEFDKGCDEVRLSLMQRFAGDMASAKVTAEQARNIFDRLYRNQPDNFTLAAKLSQTYAELGEKDSALKAAEHAISLLPRSKDRVSGPTLEENLARIQAIFGENSRAISTLNNLLQTPYSSWVSTRAPVTPALLRLDPFWDVLRGDPAFQRLCEEKQAVAAPKKSPR